MYSWNILVKIVLFTWMLWKLILKFQHVCRYVRLCISSGVTIASFCSRFASIVKRMGLLVTKLFQIYSSRYITSLILRCSASKFSKNFSETCVASRGIKFKYTRSLHPVLCCRSQHVKSIILILFILDYIKFVDLWASNYHDTSKSQQFHYSRIPGFIFVTHLNKRL